MKRTFLIYALILAVAGAAIVGVLHLGSSLPAPQGFADAGPENAAATLDQGSAFTTLTEGLLTHLEQPLGRLFLQLLAIILVSRLVSRLFVWMGQPAVIGEMADLVGIQSALPAASYLPIGTALRCSVRITHGVPNYLAFDGEVFAADGTRWMTASIQAYRPDESEQPGVSS